MRWKYKRLAGFLGTALFLLSSLSGAGAAGELESRQERIDAIEEEQEQVREKLSELEALKDDVSAYIEAVNEEIEKAGDSLTDLEKRMETVRGEIETAKAELEAANESEREQYETMKIRIQYMYEKGDTLFLEMLFQSASLTEFLNRAEYISRISEYDRTMLTAYRDTRQLITERTEQLEEAYASLETMTAQAEAKRRSLSELELAKEEELSGLNVEISENQDLMADYDEALKDELEEFIALEEAIRLREEEEARALAELEEASREAERTTEAPKETETQTEERKEEPESSGTEEEETSGDTEETSGEITETKETQETETPAETTSKASVETPTKPPAVSIDFLWPVPSCGRISSGYGSRDDPLTGEADGNLSDHHGIDIALPGGALAGADIVAAADGEVIIARSSVSAGNWIVIYHGNSTYTVYMHCQKLFVSAGDKVEQGDSIGLVGSTGWSTGPHLHFEVRVGGFSTSAYSKNPLNYVSPP
ncbi:MAG: peptidoglycan DD-metalloendopeptidase family protein [Lachnospiraceae bacterium]|nr:peptidoglycan DD-metalloendopeptidase family protein [Lachnospiraceae bacterium]